jgi:hypothetical protein
MDRELTLILKLQDQISKDLKKISEGIDSSGAAAKKSGGLFGGLGLKVAGLAGAYFAVKEGVLGSLNAFSEQAEQQQKLTSIILNHEGATMGDVKALLDQAEAIQNTTVASEELVLAAQAQLATFDLMPQSIHAIIPGLIDMTIAEKGLNATSEDAKNIAQGLGKAFQGQFDVLRKQGFVITDTQKKMIEFGGETEKVKAIAEILGTTYEDVAKDMLVTWPGMVKFVKNQVGELQESFGSGFAAGIQQSFSDIFGSFEEFSSSLSEAKGWLKEFGYTAVQVFTLFGRVVWNSMQNVYEAVKGTFGAIGGIVVDFGNNLAEMLEGNFTYEATNMEAAWDGMKTKIEGNLIDIGDAMNDFGDNMESGVKEPVKGVTAAFGNMKSAGTNASEEIGKKMEAAAKKISDLQKQMKKAIQSAKEDIKKFKEEFEDTELKKQQEFQDSVAQIIVDKQNELVDLKKNTDGEMTDSEKVARDEQIKTIEDFLEKHIEDTRNYAAEIQAIKEFQALDEIEQLKFTFAEEKKLRQEDYADQLKDLKAHLKEVEKEYKDKLKDLRSALKKELGDITITVDVAKSGSTKKRAMGGPVQKGEPYIVGERRAELFVPNESGRIVPSLNGLTSQGSGSSGITVNITGNTLLDSRAAEKMGDLIIQKLKLNYQQ